MVRYRRNLVAGGTFFITATMVDRRSHALVDHIGLFRESVRETRRRKPFTIDAIVILPDHFHIVLTLPTGDAGFSNRLSLIKRRFTDALVATGLSLTRRQNGQPMLWQRRFWERTIRSDEDLERHVDYIHFNPVKHQLVTRVHDWPHSSFHWYVRQELLPKDWGGDFRHFDGRSFGE